MVALLLGEPRGLEKRLEGWCWALPPGLLLSLPRELAEMVLFRVLICSALSLLGSFSLSSFRLFLYELYNSSSC